MRRAQLEPVAAVHASASAGVEAGIHRVVVIGSGGAGKTTFAAALVTKLSVPHVELDALYWGPNWTGAGGSPEGDAVFRERITAATASGAWVADGNYSIARDLLWPKAETIVWLDYPLSFVLYRLLWRTVRRMLTREVLWGTNRESFRLLFLSRDSLLLYVLKTQGRRRRQFEALLARPEMAHLRVLRFFSPREAEAWLGSVASVTDDRSSS
jgi:adenylate kinase family enzyme